MQEEPHQPRSKIRRSKENARYERSEIDRALDEAFICHVALPRGTTVVSIPMMFARVGDRIFIHGSVASQLVRDGAELPEVSISVATVTGLVLARSIFEHSLNYSSVVLFGRLEAVQEVAEKNEALRGFSEKILPGRWEEVRPPSPKELRATSILKMDIAVASAKVRSGPPTDGDSVDGELPVWAGVVPIHTSFGTPEPDPLLRRDVVLPPSVQRLGSTVTWATSPPGFISRTPGRST